MRITQSLKVIALALALSIGISYVSAWTAPTATPPSNNVSAPVNVSSNAQLKTGDFSAWTLISNSVITNALRIPTGASAGKVLTADASGNATWQAGTPGPQGPAGAAGPAGATGPQGPAGTVPSGELCGVDSWHTGDSGGGLPGYGSAYTSCMGAARGTCPAGYSRILTGYSTYDATTYFYSCAKN